MMENNFDLYNYLVKLENILRGKNYNDLAEKVHFASRFVSGSSSEFLGEALDILTILYKDHCDALSDDELCEMRDAIDAIINAFESVGSIMYDHIMERIRNGGKRSS